MWQLYVIELGGSPSSSNPHLPRVHVGETSKSPEARLQEHLEGARNRRVRLYSSVVHREGGHLRPDLVLIAGVYYTQGDSRRAEANLADLCATKGTRSRADTEDRIAPSGQGPSSLSRIIGNQAPWTRIMRFIAVRQMLVRAERSSQTLSSTADLPSDTRTTANGDT